MQLSQYEAMVRRDARADPAHVEALLRLVGRRPDADLVFADAGRRAARRAVRRLFLGSRLAARAAPRMLGYGVARRAARAVFGGELRREGGVPVARVGDPIAVNANPDGAACALYGTGFAELLRLLARVACRAAGAGARPHTRDGGLAAGRRALSRPRAPRSRAAARGLRRAGGVVGAARVPFRGAVERGRG